MTWFRVYKVYGEVMTTIGWTTSLEDAKNMCHEETGAVWRIVREEPKE